MVHKDTEGGKFLIKIGVSPQKFSSQNLSANHFDTISTPTSCELIEAIAADSKNYDSAFDLVLDTFKTNKRTFNILCSQVENIWNCGAEAAYKIINDNNTRWLTMILSGVMGIFPMILKSGHMQMVIDAPYISGENDSSDDSYLD